MSASPSCSGVPLLTHLLLHSSCSHDRIAAITLEALWSQMLQEWRTAVQRFVQCIRDNDVTSDVRTGFRDGMSSLMLLVCACRRNAVLPRAWTRSAEATVFGAIVPSVTDAFVSTHDAYWDEFYAAVLPVLGVLAQQCEGELDEQMLLHCASHHDDDEDGSAATNWCSDALANIDNTYPQLCQNIALLLAIGMGFDGAIASASTRGANDNGHLQEAFAAVFLQCANMLSDASLVRLLLCAVHRGSIRGDQLYATDLDVLLCILQRYATQQEEEEASDAEGGAGVASGGPATTPKSSSTLDCVHRCEALLLHDIAPSRSAAVDDVIVWMQRLGLEGDYQSVVRRQGVDGEVLWSDLSVDDIMEMGIYSRRDACKVCHVLAATRGRSGRDGIRDVARR